MQKATVLAILLLGIIALGAIMVNRSMEEAQARPAVQRQLSQVRLAELVAAIQQYQAAHQVWPDKIKQILHEARLPVTSTAIRGAGIYRYQRPSDADPPDTIIIWSDRPYDGVAIGEPYGGEGEVATEAIPPLAYVVTKALTIETLSPDDWAKRIPLGTTSSSDAPPDTVEPAAQ
jgi:hypothetical protein